MGPYRSMLNAAGISPFFICVPVTAQQRINATCRAFHRVSGKERGLQLYQRDIGILFDQFREEGDKRLQLAIPFPGPRRKRLQGFAIPDLLIPTASISDSVGIPKSVLI